MAGFGKLCPKQHRPEEEGAIRPGPFPSEQITTPSSFLKCSRWGLDMFWFSLLSSPNTEWSVCGGGEGYGGLEKVFLMQRREERRKQKGMLMYVQRACH